MVMFARCLFIMVISLTAVPAFSQSSAASAWNFKREMLPALVETVPTVLKSYDAKTGRLGVGLWIPDDQSLIYPLAAAWATESPANRFYHDPKLLEIIMHGGDAIIQAQGKDGRWEFRKKDNSVWGQHFSPWVYSRWIRTFSLIRDAMPPERRDRWEKALTLGYSGIARRDLPRVHNIPAHHAMGLFIAGKTLNRPEWVTQASEFLRRVAAAQTADGFWSEHYGPVVSYNFVYVDALGIYYALSHDETVRPALERAAHFHTQFVYPDGSSIETIDERVPYSPAGHHLAGPGFSFTQEGRAYLQEEWKRVANLRITKVADMIASMLLYGQEGEIGSLPAQKGNSVFTTQDGRASVVRKAPWCAAFSAYACGIDSSRWIQDRQNFVSLFHERTGLILGGGNTKLQPLWSTFTVGDTKLIELKPGDKHPNFSEPKGLQHVPSAAELDSDGNGLHLHYGAIDGTVKLTLLESNKARLTYAIQANAAEAKQRAEESGQKVTGHITFLPSVTKTWCTASGKSGTLEKPFELSEKEAGEWFEHNGWRVRIPKGSKLIWPVKRFNPYRDDGRSDLEDARIVLALPFSGNTTAYQVEIEALEWPAVK